MRTVPPKVRFLIAMEKLAALQVELLSLTTEVGREQTSAAAKEAAGTVKARSRHKIHWNFPIIFGILAFLGGCLLAYAIVFLPFR